MATAANGPVLPGRNSITAKSIFFSGKGDDLRCHLLFCMGDSGAGGPGLDTECLSPGPRCLLFTGHHK